MQRLERLTPLRFGDRRCRQRALASPFAQGFQHLRYRSRWSVGFPGLRLILDIALVVERASLAYEQPLGLGYRQRLDVSKLARDGAGPHFCVADRVAGLLQLFPGGGEDVAELGEFGLDHSQAPPHLARPLLDRERAKSHLQGIERCRKRRRSDDVDAALTRERVGGAGTR